jgi:NitT/TauT family transport system substrate-binding protein
MFSLSTLSSLPVFLLAARVLSAHHGPVVYLVRRNFCNHSRPRARPQKGKEMMTKIMLTIAAVLFPMYGAAAQALKEIKIGSSNISYTNFSAFYARDRKFFEKEGLSPKIIVVKTEAALPAMATGQLDYTTLTTSTIEAAMVGMPLRLVAVANQQPLWGLVVSKGITQISDLKGKKLGVSSYGGAAYGAALAVLRAHGLEAKKDVIVLATGDNTSRIAALKHGSVDAALIAAPGDIKVAEEGYKILLDAGTIYKLPMGGVSTSLAKIQENPSEVKKAVAAVVKASKFISDPKNKEDVVNYIISFFKLDRGAAVEFYQRLVPSLSSTGVVDRDKIKLVIDSAMERGLTTKAPDQDALVDFTFAKELGF